MFKTAKEEGSEKFRVDPFKKVVYEQEPEEDETEKVSEEDFSNKSLSDKLDIMFNMMKSLDRKIDENDRRLTSTLDDLSMIAGRERERS